MTARAAGDILAPLEGPMLLSVLLLACGDKTEGEDTAADGAASEEGEEEGPAWSAAELAPLSSGECPDLSASGLTSTFLTGSDERTVTIYYPEARPEGMRVVFFFHGLTDTSMQPAEYLANALDMQAIAEEENAIVILPLSGTWEMLGYEFYLWAVEDGTFDADLTFYDDLRTCVAQEFNPDMDGVVAMGLSGGALFTTVVASQRADTLAAVVEMSGGSDIEIPLETIKGLIAPYETPAWDVPALLMTGGENDVWPGGGLTVVDFTAATDTLQAQLAADGSFVVRCEHSQGHTITSPEFNAARDWARSHTYGEASPYAAAGIGDWESWCQVVE